MGNNQPSPFSSVVLLGLALLTWVFLFIAGLWWAPVGGDGAYYLSHARYVSQGLVPFADFPSPYAPGVYYLYALLGPEGFSNWLLCKMPMYFCHAVNLVLIVLIMRKTGLETADAIFFGMVFAVWVMICDGQFVLLEPFQNVLILASFYVLLLSRSLAFCALAGLVAGAALMMKQLSLPVAAGDLVLILSAGVSSPANPHRSWKQKVLAAMLFSACCAVPFFAFVLINRLPPVETLIQFATFGGQGGSYGAFNLRYFFDVFIGRSPHALLPLNLCFFLGLWFITAEKPVEWRAVVVMFWLFSAELLIQPFGHYVQLAAPWGVILIAGFCARHGWGLFRQTQGNLALLLLFVLWFIPGTLRTVRETISLARQHPIQTEERLAMQVRAKLPSTNNVLVVNAPWLYFAANLTPPHRNHQMTFKTKQLPGWFTSMADEAKYVVVFPEPIEYPPETVTAFLKTHAFEEFAAFPAREPSAISPAESPEQPILLFQRKPAP